MELFLSDQQSTMLETNENNMSYCLSNCIQRVFSISSLTLLIVPILSATEPAVSHLSYYSTNY